MARSGASTERRRFRTETDGMATRLRRRDGRMAHAFRAPRFPSPGISCGPANLEPQHVAGSPSVSVPKRCSKSNASRLREPGSNPAASSVGSNPSASCGDHDFFELALSGAPGVGAIQLQDVVERLMQAGDQFGSGRFLCIDSRDLLDPPDPPVSVALDDCRVLAFHPDSLACPGIDWEDGTFARIPRLPDQPRCLPIGALWSSAGRRSIPRSRFNPFPKP